MAKVLIVLLTMVVLALATAGLVRQLKSSPNPRRWVNLLFPLSQICMIGFLFYNLFDYDLPLWLFALVAAIGMLCAAGDLVLFEALVSSERKELAEQRVQLLESQMVVQNSYFSQAQSDASKAELIRASILDELQAARELLKSEEFERASEKLRGTAGLMELQRTRLCEHRVVDALVSAKAAVCREEGIEASFDLSIPENVSIPSVDLCAVFSNLIDNAIHACQLIENGPRTIAVKARVIGGYLVVETLNACVASTQEASSRARARKGASPLSEHGWGLPILEAIAARHDGSFNIEEGEGTFLATVMLRATMPVSS